MALYPASAGIRRSIAGRERTRREAKRGTRAPAQHRREHRIRSQTGIPARMIAHIGPSSGYLNPRRVASATRGMRHSEVIAPTRRKQMPTRARTGESHWFSWRAEASLACWAERTRLDRAMADPEGSSLPRTAALSRGRPSAWVRRTDGMVRSMANMAHSPATVVPWGAAKSEAPSWSITVTDTMGALIGPPISGKQQCPV